MIEAFRERRPFPGQDPWVVTHEGCFLLVQSADGDRKIVIRRFDDLDRMDRNDETVVWDPGGVGDHAQEIWAPELHRIGRRWYIYFAASDGRSANHRSWALGADDPLGPYRELGAVRDPRDDVWSIDLTVFRHARRLYAVWSGWEGPHDGFPQNLYIAPMSGPATISGERRCISRPQHGWELSVAPVNEGPEVIRNPSTGQLFILYAADASWTQAYKTGVLEWTGGDVADPSSWHKRPQPFFTGGGHGCVVDTEGGPAFVYHRKLGPGPGWADREIRWAPMAWDAEGRPTLAPKGPTGGPSGRPARGPGPLHPTIPTGLGQVA